MAFGKTYVNYAAYIVVTNTTHFTGVCVCHNGVMDLHTLLVIGHVVGTILGVGGATVAEMNIVQALKDGKVDTSEKQLMHANYTMIRVGMAIVFLSGVTLVWWHLAQGNTWVLTSPKIWVKDLIFIIIILNAVALARHWVPLWLGAAVSFASWWTAAVLGLWRLHAPFWMIFGGYIVAIVVAAVALHFIRTHYIGKKA